MKVVFLAVVTVMILSAGAFAQDGRFSLGAEIGLPMGTFGDAASIGIGGSLRYEMPLSGNDNLALMATAGYLTFSGKDITVSGVTIEGSSQSMIPIQVGAKYYFDAQHAGFYASAQMGVHMSSYTIPGQDAVVIGGITYAAATEDRTETATNFSYAPGVGYALDNIDIGLRYQIVSAEGGSSSYLGVRIAYVFGGQ